MAKETAVSIRITEEQKTELEKQAKIHGTSVSPDTRKKGKEVLLRQVQK